MNIEEIKRRYAAVKAQSDKLWEEIEDHRQEEQRVIHVLANTKSILDRLDRTFEQRTSLSKTDVSILMLATALQLVRIYLLPAFKEKFKDEDRIPHNAESVKDESKRKVNWYVDYYKDVPNNESKKGFRTWQQIASSLKVPYDATNNAGKGFAINMHGNLHRIKALGHDPVLGWVFGVANIITDTITIAPEYKINEKNLRIPYIQSYNVDMHGLIWLDQTPTSKVLYDTYESVSEDYQRLNAAVFAHAVHLKSDIFSPKGLPMPLLSMIDQDKAYQIYREGYDYLDFLYDSQILRRAFDSAYDSIIINVIIGSIHKLFYNPNKDNDKALYNVRTRKVILYSNIIATSSDILQTAIRTIYGEDNALKNFDMGGFMITLYRLLKDTDFIAKVKEEFIFKEWDAIVESKNNIYKI